jgi:hypothetical protein
MRVEKEGVLSSDIIHRKKAGIVPIIRLRYQVVKKKEAGTLVGT